MGWDISIKILIYYIIWEVACRTPNINKNLKYWENVSDNAKITCSKNGCK